jgi:N-acetylglucosamine-6-phosphate deacetylase
MSAPIRHAIGADTVFDGLKVRQNCAVVVEDSRIISLVSRGDLSPSLPLHALPKGAWLAPGFIDCQVNGGGDVLFNDAPTPQTIATIAAAHRRYGTTSLLPTLISDSDENMRRAIAAVQTAMATQAGVLGIHLEGPFLSPEKAGVHDPRMIRAPEAHHREMLTSLKSGATLVTCAPERVPAGFIRDLAAAGIRISLGHSMASYDETKRAIAEGMTGFTHLFNAMRPLLSRDPGPIAAALESANCFYGLIVDGEHVAPPMLKLALSGAGTPLLITDAMPPVGGNKSSFKLYGEDIRVQDGRCVTKDGKLAGSVIDMASAVRNCVRLLGLPLSDALALATLEPARFLGLDRSLGRLGANHRADMVAFEPKDVRVLGTWLAGEYKSSS